MAVAKKKRANKTLSFDQYKAVKDEIIDISEQRFANLLTKRLKEFKNEFKDELMQYLVYYNNHRPHHALGGITPKEFLEKLSTN